MTGCFIVIEGPSGVGKSTAVAQLTGLLRRDGLRVHPTKEPTHTTLGRAARYGTDEYRGLTLACLVAADRYHHLETEVRPTVAAGGVVLCDRYLASSLVLQRLDGVEADFIWALNRYADRPDLTLVLTGDPGRSRTRAATRGVHSRFHRGGPVAGGQEQELYKQVADELAVANHPVHVHDVGEQTPEEVATALLVPVRQVLRAHAPTIEAPRSNES